MFALVTGASSGIGYEISKYLNNRGYSIIAVGQNEERLNNLKDECKNNKVIIEKIDLSDINNCKLLYEKYKNYDIEILVNSAGIGIIGEFKNSDLDEDLKLINLNISATHILTKLFLKDMLKNNKGYILNVASSAAFAPGPLMSVYYASKSYVHKFSTAINIELKNKKSNVVVSTLCPGPVQTKFNDRLNISYSVKPITAERVAKYAVEKMFKRKQVIVPGIKNKIGVFFNKILPEVIISKYIYNMQKKKMKDNNNKRGK